MTLITSLCAGKYADVHEKWPSPTPWMTDRFTDFLKAMPKNGIVAEIGVQGGAFAACIKRQTNPTNLYLIDCWEYQDPTVFDDPEANVSNSEQDKLYLETVKRFARDPRVKILRKYSHDAVKSFSDETFDWVYIDANHGYEAAKQDIALWWPKVKKGGFLAGHDYIVRESFGVVRAVNEFLIANDLELKCLTQEIAGYDSWAIQKQ